MFLIFNNSPVIVIIILLVIFSTGRTLVAEENLEKKMPKIIVLDPGHGGEDRGIKINEELYEKDVVLELAQAIKKELSSDDQYKVYLTRTKDRNLSVLERVNQVNSKSPEVFMSLHLFKNAEKAKMPSINIYVNTFIKNEELFSEVATALEADIKILPWDMAQNSALKYSRKLGGYIIDFWKDFNAELNLQYISPELYTMPLSILQGVKVPAVLVEFSCVQGKSDLVLLEHKEILVKELVGKIKMFILRG